MKYKLVNATNKNIDLLIKYKLDTVLEYANNIEESEIIKIKNYVNKTTKDEINKYKLIEIDNNIIGCFLIKNKDDGVLLDEIYIEKKHRNNSIGTSIINNILFSNKIVYLWVYKLNTKAIKLYKSLGFIIILETEERYYMKYNNLDN